MYFLHRESPDKAAPREWDVPTVAPNLLPKLRSASDIAWGFWNRVAAPNKLQNIKMFMSIGINNKETAPVIIPRAMKGARSGTDDVLPWPGTEFIVGADGKEGEAAEALIGNQISSPPSRIIPFYPLEFRPHTHTYTHTHLRFITIDMLT